MSNTNEVSDNVASAQRNLEQQFGAMHQDEEKEEQEPDAGGQAEGKEEPATASEAKEPDAGGAEAAEAAEDGDPEAAAAAQEGPKDDDAGSQDEAAPEAKEVPEEKPAPKKALKKDWGLDILVQVGETWIDSLLEADDMVVRMQPALALDDCELCRV